MKPYLLCQPLSRSWGGIRAGAEVGATAAEVGATAAVAGAGAAVSGLAPYLHYQIPLRCQIQGLSSNQMKASLLKVSYGL